jgi:hypothetical protein
MHKVIEHVLWRQPHSPTGTLYFAFTNSLQLLNFHDLTYAASLVVLFSVLQWKILDWYSTVKTDITRTWHQESGYRYSMDDNTLSYIHTIVFTVAKDWNEAPFFLIFPVQAMLLHHFMMRAYNRVPGQSIHYHTTYKFKILELHKARWEITAFITNAVGEQIKNPY